MNEQKIILEGVDDKHVVKNLLYNHNLDMFEYKTKEGIDSLLSTLHEEIEGTDWRRLGIIIDADADAQTQWSRVSRILEATGFTPLPSQPQEDGTIVSDDEQRKIGVWIMPNNVLHGAIEDFVSYLMKEEDTLWPRADRVVEDIPVKQRKFKASFITKAKIHTWLAWQEEPGTRMGAAFKKNYLDPTRPDAISFVNWIKRLVHED